MRAIRGAKRVVISSRVAIVAALLLAPLPAAADMSDALKAIERRDFATALQQLSPLAKAGDAEAQYQLGTLYANGDGVPQSYQTARELFSAAASQGNVQARQALDFLIQIGAIPAPVAQEAPPGTHVQTASMPAIASAAAPASTAGAAETASAPPPAGSFRLQLGTVPTEAGGTLEARRVVRLYHTQLAGLTVATEPFQMGSGDIVYRVLTPALAEAQAREICDQIRGQGGNCLLIRP
jgi:hypothetical protein